MLILNNLSKRYFEVEFMGRKLSLEPPSLKIMQKIQNATTTEDLTECAVKILNKNREKLKVSLESVENDPDLDTVEELISGYINWLYRIKTDPN